MTSKQLRRMSDDAVIAFFANNPRVHTFTSPHQCGHITATETIDKRGCVCDGCGEYSPYLASNTAYNISHATCQN